MRYLPWLERREVELASVHNHGHWGRRRTREQHVEHALAQLDNAGPELLRYVGLVDDGGALVSAAKRYALWVRSPDGAVVRAVGLGAVFTREDARGRGAATELVRAMLEEAKGLGYGAALLYSDIGAAFYERHGFVTLPALDRSVLASALPRDGALGLRAVQPTDESALSAWYEASWEGDASRWLRPVRSPATWKYFRWRNRIRGEWVLRHAGRDVGYLIAARDDHDGGGEDRALWIEEWSAPGLPRDRVLATVRLLAEREDARTVRGALRPDHGSAPFVAKPRDMAIPMVASLDGRWQASPEAAHFGSYEHF